MDAPSPNVDSKSPPAAPEEAMDVQSTKFEDGVWYRKYQLLKRKCSEFEQVNKPLVHHVCVIMHEDPLRCACNWLCGDNYCSTSDTLSIQE